MDRDRDRRFAALSNLHLVHIHIMQEISFSLAWDIVIETYILFFG